MSGDKLGSLKFMHRQGTHMSRNLECFRRVNSGISKGCEKFRYESIREEDIESGATRQSNGGTQVTTWRIRRKFQFAINHVNVREV